MIEKISFKNVGPSPELETEFSERLNLITGDNGLGKSFLLDTVWWAMTRHWPAQVNSQIIGGRMARPVSSGEASITHRVRGKKGSAENRSIYWRPAERWAIKAGRPVKPGLVLYMMSDGSIAIWDPARNYWKEKGESDRLPAYVFTPKELWNGKKKEKNSDDWVCNGLIRDWARWQDQNELPWKLLLEVLKTTSPPELTLEPGNLTRVSLDDARDMPTIKMPYGQDTPLIHCSSAIQRVLSFAYSLVWAWTEHEKVSEILLNEESTNNIVFLIDEIESHLHPRWQKTILHSIIKAAETLKNEVKVQLIATTHSPLVTVGAEDFFDPQQDRWLDFDLRGDTVELTTRDWEAYGVADAWLKSEAFDLISTRSPHAEALLQRAIALSKNAAATHSEWQRMTDELAHKLAPCDRFLTLWRSQMESKFGML